MIDQIHYLMPHPENSAGLIYPSELGDELYVGFGGLFIMGGAGATLAESYRIHAIRGEQIVEARLNRYKKSTNFFRAEIKDIGAFLFYARAVVSG